MSGEWRPGARRALGHTRRGRGGTGARTEDELGRRLRTVIEVCPRIAIVPLGTIPRPEFKASCVRDQRREEQGRGRCAGGPGQLC
jgi:hypothetical protein